MKGKLVVALLVLAVAAVAFVVGRQYGGTQAPAEEAAPTQATAPEPVSPPAAAEPVPEPAPTPSPAPVRRRASAPRSPEPEVVTTPASEPVSEPAPEIIPAAVTTPPVVEPAKIRLAEGTKIVFALNSFLSTKTNQPGDPFTGVVTRPVRMGETTVIPENSVIRGTVAHVERPGRVKGRGELGLRFDEIELPDGELYALSASLTDLGEGEKQTVTEEGTVKSEGTKKRDAATIGGGAGIGAVIGAIAGGGKGAATGGAIGAGAGTGLVLLTRGKDVELRRGTELAIQLDRPLAIAVK